MKKLVTPLVLFALALAAGTTEAQEKPKSPKETVKGVIDGANVEIVYCRPSARGRKMLGGNEAYGKVWRTGANEATTIEFDRDVKIEGKPLPKGKYELFTIPGENEWTIIIQKYGKQWGAYDYKESNDVLRTTVKAGKADPFVETFTIATEKDAINLKWENTSVSFKVSKA
jgi:hypothetical protein